MITLLVALFVLNLALLAKLLIAENLLFRPMGVQLGATTEFENELLSGGGE